MGILSPPGIIVNMPRINYLQELRGLENRLEKKMDDSFDHFAMIIQEQFADIIKTVNENRVDTSRLEAQTEELRSQTAELRQQTAEIRSSTEELKQQTIELRASNLKHDISIAELKAASVRQEAMLAEVKDIAREVKEISKNHEGRVVALEESAFA